MEKNKTATKIGSVIYPLLSAKERALIWEKAKGIWKNKKPDPIKILKKIRKESDRF